MNADRPRLFGGRLWAVALSVGLLVLLRDCAEAQTAFVNEVVFDHQGEKFVEIVGSSTSSSMSVWVTVSTNDDSLIYSSLANDGLELVNTNLEENGNKLIGSVRASDISWNGEISVYSSSGTSGTLLDRVCFGVTGPVERLTCTNARFTGGTGSPDSSAHYRMTNNPFAADSWDVTDFVWKIESQLSWNVVTEGRVNFEQTFYQVTTTTSTTTTVTTLAAAAGTTAAAAATSTTMTSASITVAPTTTTSGAVGVTRLSSVGALIAFCCSLFCWW